MKLESQNEQVFGNSGQRTSFTIGASSKAFQILSSGIYKNKIRAIVREVICNAVDAHSLNGTAKSYEIKVPSHIDPRFIVTDYGPGLSHESMIEIYTQYFASTKNGNEIGGFGLGAKSPFSYTDTFSVESRHCGIARSYTAMIVNGQPEMTMTYEGQMSDNESSGITVTVPVKLDDIKDWEKEISYILRPFRKSSYKLSGSLQVYPLEDLKNYSKNWFGTNETLGVDSRGIYAIYGNIVYPLDRTPGIDANWLLSKNRTVYINFDMNTLMPQPSREELQDDEVTVKNIIDRVNNLNNSMMEEDLEYLENIENRRALARAVNALTPEQHSILEDANYKIQGKSFGNLTEFKDSHFTKIVKLLNGPNTARVFICQRGSILARPLYEASSYASSRNKVIANSTTLFNYKQTQATIIIDDLKGKHLRTALKGMFIHSNLYDYRGIIVIDERDSIKDEIINEVKSLMEGDAVEILKLSELEKYKALVPNYGVKRSKAYTERPKYPNAVRYAKTASGYGTEELYMSNADIADYSGLVIGAFGVNEFKALSTNFSFVTGVDKWATINFLMQHTHHDSVLFVRPSIYKKVSKNEQCTCGLLALSEELVDVIDSIKHDEYLPTNSLTNFDKNIRNKPALTPIYGLMGLKYSKEARDKLHLVENTISSALRNIPAVNSAIVKFFDNQKAAKTLHSEAIAKFKSENPIAEFILNNSYVSDELVNALAKQLGI